MFIDNIDLEKDGVIEASAGTGKTFTINELVKRIISEGKASPEEIVVLTFTEKATRELENRIRETINKSVCDENENLKNAAINFDQFNIFTIHGFCNFLIRNFPFEFNVPINAEVSVVPRKMLLNSLVLNELPKFLELRGIKNIEEDFDIDNKIQSPVLKIIENLSFEKGHRLRVEGFEEEFKYSGEVKRFIEENKELNEKDFTGFIIYYFILRLIEEEEKYKKRRWIITYDDMIKKVYRGLKENENFKKKLSSLFKYIIVDEFQDTDLLQWNIFREIKNCSERVKIYIVGDPKQAIYGFRGGDIHTYFLAKSEILKWGGKLYHLSKNHRSNRCLVEALNFLFEDIDCDGDKRKKWFEKNLEDIEFSRVEAEKDIQLKGIEALNIFLINSEKAKDAYNIWKNFVSGEICRLVKDGYFKKSEVLILCKTVENARDYEEHLFNCGINARFYDREGTLFLTREALNIKILLFTLAFPEDLNLKKQLFLSEIFGVEFKEINNFFEAEDNLEGLKSGEKRAVDLFNHWIFLVGKKEWGELFDSVYFESGMFLRIFEENSIEEASSIVSRYNQIAEVVKEIAYSKNLNIFNLALEFKRMMEEENKKIYMDEDEDFVKIMTIHSAKGLEAPVVFIGDGFTKVVKYPYFKYYNEKESKYFFVIRTGRNGGEEKELTQLEVGAEEERLYYVAFTRAIYSLYFAIAEITTKRGGNKGAFCSWIKDWVLEKKLAKKLPLENRIESLVREKEEVNIRKVFAGEIDFNRKSYMASFSRIKREIKEREGITEIEISEEIEDVNHTEFCLCGAGFGSAIHEILEEINFSLVNSIKSFELFASDETIKKLIFSHLERYFSNITEKDYMEVALMIFNALSYKILENFSLSMIEDKKKLSELEFYYKIDERLFLTGAMDLVFENNSKFYIVDWKTNILDDYEGEVFFENVESSYGLQYRIYTLALWEQLKNLYIDEAYKRLGGIFYIYLRGVNEKGAGIFYRKIEIEDIENFKKDVKNNYLSFIEFESSRTI